MKKIMSSLIGLSCLFSTTACDSLNAPPQKIDTPTPEWAEQVKVYGVSKYSASVINSQGERIRVSRSGTDIGNGLTATRDFYDLYVTDKNGTTCNWDSGERLAGCKEPNPAYEEYMNSLPN